MEFVMKGSNLQVIMTGTLGIFLCLIFIGLQGNFEWNQSGVLQWSNNWKEIFIPSLGLIPCLIYIFSGIFSFSKKKI